jgi:hypothetical protein
MSWDLNEPPESSRCRCDYCGDLGYGLCGTTAFDEEFSDWTYYVQRHLGVRAAGPLHICGRCRANLPKVAADMGL